MKSLVIIGAGGFGREVAWLAEKINHVKNEYERICFVDDNLEIGTKVNGYEVIGTIESLINNEDVCDITIAIGNSVTRKAIAERLMKDNTKAFPNLIDPDVDLDIKKLGKGNIICSGNILTVDYTIGDFNIINLSSTVGHDVEIGNYVTVYPGVNISGNVTIEDLCEIGTGTKIIQGVNIGRNTILGAGSVIISDIPKDVMAAGVPAKVKKEREVL